MLKQKKNVLMVGALSALLAPLSLNAGSMGDVSLPKPDKYLLIEGGVSYMHAFYKDRVVGADSYTVESPAGRSYNPSRLFPDDFFGGYMGASLMLNSYLLNARYELFESKSKLYRKNNRALLSRMAPAKLAFTVDKTWKANHSFLYGIGAGAVASTHNKAELFNYQPGTYSQIGHSFPGRVRLDPLVEALAMYRVSDHFNVRGNVSYQIPAHSFYTNGHLGVNLGINYAVPI